MKNIRKHIRLFNRNQIALSELSDTELIHLAKENKDAFGELYERYVGKIYSYIYHRTSNENDAEDLTARVFFRALSHIENYVDKGVPFQAWLYRIAHNLVANWYRDQGRRKIIPLDDYVAHTLKSEGPDKQAEASEDQEMLLSAFRKLPEERQQLLILKFLEHKSNAEIGMIMDRTEGAIKSLYHRTLLALRDELQIQQMTIKSQQPTRQAQERKG